MKYTKLVADETLVSPNKNNNNKKKKRVCTQPWYCKPPKGV